MFETQGPETRQKVLTSFELDTSEDEFDSPYIYWVPQMCKDKISLKLCESFRFFLKVFMEKIQIIRYLNYMRRRKTMHFKNCVTVKYASLSFLVCGILSFLK